MARWFLHVLAALSVAALAAACGGLSTVEAEQRCDQERAADAIGCVDDAAYEQCVTCFDDCGDDCTKGTSCPAQFTCPD
jgi:hypothetical protein